MSRLTSLIAGLVALPAIAAGLAYVEPTSFPPASAQPGCINGHPARRSPDVTYGGLPSLHGYQRDHLIPLGLEGADIAANVRYQRCDQTGRRGRCEAGPAADKDGDEHDAIEKHCSGKWSLDYARSWLAAGWPVDAAHGYDKPQ